MNCQEVRELSSDYLDHRLTPEEASLLEEHTRICPGCREAIESLRETISAIGSLDEVKVSSDFLSKVHGKIERGGRIKRLLAWIFAPTILKVPLKVTALVLISISAFYIYYRSPELSEERDVLISSGSFDEAQDKRVDQLQARNALEKRDRGSRIEQTVEPEASAKLEAQLFRPGSSEVSKKTFQEQAESAPQSRFREILTDDVVLFEQRVKSLLGEIGGRLLIQEGFADSLLLTVEVPQSRQEQFLAALREEAVSDFETGQRALQRAGEFRKKKETEFKDSPSPASRSLEPARKFSLGAEEPMVTLRLRIQPKK